VLNELGASLQRDLRTIAERPRSRGCAVSEEGKAFRRPLDSSGRWSCFRSGALRETFDRRIEGGAAGTSSRHLQRWDDWTNLAQKAGADDFLLSSGGVWWIEKAAVAGGGRGWPATMWCWRRPPTRGRMRKCLVSLAEEEFCAAQSGDGAGQRSARAAGTRPLRLAQILDADRPRATRVFQTCFRNGDSFCCACAWVAFARHAPADCIFGDAMPASAAISLEKLSAAVCLCRLQRCRRHSAQGQGAAVARTATKKTSSLPVYQAKTEWPTKGPGGSTQCGGEGARAVRAAVPAGDADNGNMTDKVGRGW